MDDATLAARAAEKDAGAWEEIWRRHRGPVVRALARVAPSEEADDLFSDLCLALLNDGARRLRRFDPARAGLRTYLCTIARNLARTRLKRAARRAPSDADGSPPSALDALIAREQAALARNLVASLGARDAEFLRLTVIEGLAPRAAARAMGIAQTTAYTKRHKIARRLARLAA